MMKLLLIIGLVIGNFLIYHIFTKEFLRATSNTIDRTVFILGGLFFGSVFGTIIFALIATTVLPNVVKRVPYERTIVVDEIRLKDDKIITNTYDVDSIIEKKYGDFIIHEHVDTVNRIIQYGTRVEDTTFWDGLQHVDIDKTIVNTKEGYTIKIINP